jgi:hypothetical protein
MFRFFLQRFDLVVAIVGLVAGALLLGASLLGFLSYPDYGLVLAVSCGVYLVYRNRFQISEGQEDEAAVFRPILVTVFFALISLSLVLLHFSLYGRVTLFFVLTALATGIVAWEIISFPISKLTGNLVLGQILVLFLVLRLSLFEQFPSSMLGDDPWYHLSFLMDIASKGGVPIGSQYTQFPALHIIALSFWEIAHIDLQVSFILATTLFELVGFLFTFVLAKSLTNSRIALVCTLLLTILQSSIRWGWWTTPDTVGLSLLPMLVYVTVVRESRQTRQYAFISVLTLVLIVVTHAFSTFAFFIILTFLFLASRLSRLRFGDAPKSIGLDPRFLILYCLLFISYWIYGQSGYYYWVSGPQPGFFGEVVMGFEYGFRTNIRLALGPVLSSWELLVTRGGAGFILALAILGSLIMLSPRDRSWKRFTLSLAGLALIVLTFGFQVLNLDELLPGRWVGFTQYLTIVAAAIGTYSLGLLIRRFGVRRIIVVALFLSLALVNIMAPEASFDSPLATRSNSARFALLGSEMTGANFLAHAYKGPILTDVYFKSSALRDREGRGLIPEDVRLNASISATQMLMLRKYVETAGIMVYTAHAEGILQLPPNYENMFSSSSRWNKMYSSNTISSYVPTLPSS